MHSVFRPLSASRTWLAAWLVVAVLCAQWAGLQHRIDHAGLPHAAMLDTAATELAHADENGQDARHSCVLFDGISLADSVPVLPVMQPLLPGNRVLALWIAYASWDAPLRCHFSPRAPPSI